MKGGIMDSKLLKAFLAFLIVARQNGYIGGAEGAAIFRGGKQFKFDEAGFSYWDTYYGFDPFVGQELVWAYDLGWVWAMNYYGGLIKDICCHQKELPRASAKEVYEFLRAALCQAKIEKPYRGPKSYSKGDWAYKNAWRSGSSVEDFCGSERIFYKNLVVYRGDYHGGFIKGK
ncbi:MAG: hypothetical protein AUJ32_01005 [Parcubacteria group bacterium CG1_02_40_82]|uniref:DUF5680 domain-containing protein n=4 Tax=Candidatus Portnoyibacteriota TaxID=1817913 RepID=A0A2M7IIN3_9BACT|nr:MAG: hypothetical protein AUJ32_01005 [Parcubacteria group bacterium CG1_02_40_82]PIQ75373.1 MAG: hypothetical protein COV84_01565 [Candidatus Portnoybacteria bacterium CG11_big_fil_rev_8_21_14_0_20_40_15]PIS30295.1 MAG: hypothetical protein COT41_03570 [Candidatus Portnoybacteria bacterium CG08_land_8_20_14_0_20_40_83]PIW76365.1 MAG: hypothetical protein CO001_01735 [Candidatus Portnoybacteria bacterium CG_4_8_14_3_um_filter_40_10]PIY75258.1 MAG: hypothetical protein COY85_00765 [Candidatus